MADGDETADELSEPLLEKLFAIPEGGPRTNDRPRPFPAVPGYDIERELGHGGGGVVYLATFRELKRRDAIKLPLPEADAATVIRFRSEGALMAALKHPNVVTVYTVGEAADGRPFIAMEYAEQGSLADRDDGQPWPAKSAAAAVRDLAGAVHVAHTAGRVRMIHRDLKPANVLLAPRTGPVPGLHWSDGFDLKVTDFGLARPLDAPVGVTPSGILRGTPEWMAPEQALARSNLTTAVDVHALGLLLSYFLTGRSPFRAASLLETLGLVVDMEPSPRSVLPTVPLDLDTIAKKCLAKNPSERYATARALAEDLTKYLKNLPITAKPAGRAERVAKWAKRHPARAGLVVTAAAACLALSGMGWYAYDQQRQRAATERQAAAAALAQEQTLRATELQAARDTFLEQLDGAAQLARQRAAWREFIENRQQAFALGVPRSPRALVDIAEAYLNRGDHTAAWQIADELARYADTGTVAGEVALLRGELMLLAGNTDGDAAIRQAIAAGLPPAALAYARGLLAPSPLDGLPHFEAAVAADRSYQGAWGQLVLAQTMLGRVADARVSAARAADLFPDSHLFPLFTMVLDLIAGNRATYMNGLDRLARFDPIRGANLNQLRALPDMVLPMLETVHRGDIYRNPDVGTVTKQLWTHFEVVAPFAAGMPAGAGAELAPGFFPVAQTPALRRFTAFFRAHGSAMFFGGQLTRPGSLAAVQDLVAGQPEGAVLMFQATMQWFAAHALKQAPADRPKREALLLAARASATQALAAPMLIDIRALALDLLLAIDISIDDLNPPNHTIRREALDHAKQRLAVGPLTSGDVSDFCATAAYWNGEFELAKLIVKARPPNHGRDRRPALMPKIELEIGAYGAAIRAANTLLKLNPKNARALEYLEEAKKKLAEESRELLQQGQPQNPT